MLSNYWLLPLGSLLRLIFIFSIRHYLVKVLFGLSAEPAKENLDVVIMKSEKRERCRLAFFFGVVFDRFDGMAFDLKVIFFGSLKAKLFSV